MPPLSLQARLKTIVIRQAQAQEIIPLRHRILRAGLPLEEAHFTGDTEASTRHVAAFDDSLAICCATFVLNLWEGEPAWQLRGMATDDAWQGHGLGQNVLQYAIDLVLESSTVRLFWCNARTPALDFYRRQGWEVRSEQFEIPTAGPHRKLIRRV
jgi:GNAT superfamily N-acetyltransferase